MVITHLTCKKCKKEGRYETDKKIVICGFCGKEIKIVKRRKKK